MKVKIVHKNKTRQRAKADELPGELKEKIEEICTPNIEVYKYLKQNKLNFLNS